MPFPPYASQLISLLNFDNWHLYGSFLVVNPGARDAQMIFGPDKGQAVIRVVNGPDGGPNAGLPAPNGGPAYTLYTVNIAHLPPALLTPATQQVVIVTVVDANSLTVETMGENNLHPPQVVNVIGTLI